MAQTSLKRELEVKMYQNSLKLIKWPVFCWGLIACAVIFPAASEEVFSHPLTNKCQPASYPPRPEDQLQLPDPVKSCIQMIMDLCQHDKTGRLTLTLKEQVTLLKEALKGLRKNLS